MLLSFDQTGSVKGKILVLVLTLSISRIMSRLVVSSYMSSPYVNGEIPVVVAGFVCFYFLAPRDADIAVFAVSIEVCT
jgi:hypothetical protein